VWTWRLVGPATLRRWCVACTVVLVVEIGQFSAAKPGAGRKSSKPSKYRYIDISHDMAQFELPNGERNARIYCDVLGISQSRTMWPNDEQRKASGTRAPVCQSPDGDHGYPSSYFPYEDTLFEPSSDPLPCSECPLSNWTRAGAPPCKQQWVLIVRNVATNFPDDGKFGDEVFLIKLSASGITRTKKYFEPLVNRGMMLYHWRNEITLKRVSRSTRSFAEPVFERQSVYGDVSMAQEIRLTDLLREARSFLEEPPVIGPKITGIQLPPQTA
jgi:hypothetical protein